MAITIINRRITPYTQKTAIKAIYGDMMTLTFALPEAYQAGDEYMLGLDYERTLIPTARPLCALTDTYAISGNDITFSLLLQTARLRDWVSTLTKPMPVWLQLLRKRNGVYDTLLLDDVLALPSLLDGDNIVYPGDPLEDLLAEKLDKPLADGGAGDYLAWAEGKPIWVRVDWSRIGGKPDFAAVATTGDYDDLSNKPNLETVALTGSYNDLFNKPHIGDAHISIYQGTTLKGEFRLNQTIPSQLEIDLDQGLSWQDIETQTAPSSITLTSSHTAVKQYAISASTTLDAYASPSYDVEYAEIVLDVAQGASVTAGSNIVFADAVTDGKRNICVVRWYAGAATLYVVDVADLPAQE